MLRTTLSLATLCFLFALTGCPTTASTNDANDVDAASATPSCNEIIEHCHDVDPGTGPIHDCHELAHAASSTEAICAAALENCHTICAAAVVDAGPFDAGQFDAGPVPDAPHVH